MTAKTAATATSRDPIAYATGRLSRHVLPNGISLPAAGGKFATDGSVQVWPGNTFVCHVQSGASLDALRALQEEVKLSRFARLFTFLPPSSFHMTVFQGRSPGSAADYDLAQRDRHSETLLDATRGLAFAADRTVRMVDLFCAHSLTVRGLDGETETALRQARRDLRERTGIQSDDFETYMFHITLGYLLDWVTETTARALAEFSHDLQSRHALGLAKIDLGPVAFCNFDTMHHFHPLRQMV